MLLRLRLPVPVRLRLRLCCLWWHPPVCALLSGATRATVLRDACEGVLCGLPSGVDSFCSIFKAWCNGVTTITRPAWAFKQATLSHHALMMAFCHDTRSCLS